jgi:VanZ family protein
MARGKSSNAVLWLLAAVIVLIGYGSLYPFHFIFDGSHPTFKSAVMQLSWARAGKADQVRNVLLYMPFGFCLMLWLRGRMQLGWAVLLASACGALFSFGIEMAQVYLSTRVPSWLDMSLNTGGALLGAVAGALWRRLSALVYLPPNTRQQPGDRSAMVVLAAWTAWRLADFDIHLSLARLKQALLPLLEWQFSWSQLLQYLLLWMVVAQAVTGYAHRQRNHEVLLSVIVLVLAGRLLLVTPPFTPAELVALALLLPSMVLLHRFRSTPQHIVVLAAFLIEFIYERMAPFNFGPRDHGFDLWPFLGWIEQGMPIEAEPLFRKLFMFSAMIWLLKDAGLRLRQAWLMVGVLVLCFEVLHLWQPGRSSSLTNPTLVLLVGWLMYSVSQERLRQRQRHRVRFR